MNPPVEYFIAIPVLVCNDGYPFFRGPHIHSVKMVNNSEKLGEKFLWIFSYLQCHWLLKISFFPSFHGS